MEESTPVIAGVEDGAKKLKYKQILTKFHDIHLTPACPLHDSNKIFRDCGELSVGSYIEIWGIWSGGSRGMWV